MQAPVFVLQVSAFFPAHGGGIEVVAGRLAEGLAERGWHIHWMAGGAPEEVMHDCRSGGLSVEWVRSVDFLERRLGVPFPMWGLRGCLRLWQNIGRADIVHVHDFLYLPSFISVIFAKFRRKPIVITQHIGAIDFRSSFARVLLGFLNRTVGRWVLQAAQRVVFVGRPVRDYFCSFSRLAGKATLIANGVDHATYYPAVRTGNKKLKFLFVGRFVEKKGIAFLRECVDIPGVEWDFVGWGPLSPLSWGRAVRVHEGVRAADVVSFYQQADLLVLPSTGEGFPLVLQESLACGTPVLVSDEVKDAFPSYDDGCVFSVDMKHPQAAELLRRRLCELAAAPELLQQGRLLSQRLAGQWSWVKCTESYSELYLDVLGGR